MWANLSTITVDMNRNILPLPYPQDCDEWVINMVEGKFNPIQLFHSEYDAVERFLSHREKGIIVSQLLPHLESLNQDFNEGFKLSMNLTNKSDYYFQLLMWAVEELFEFIVETEIAGYSDNRYQYIHEFMDLFGVLTLYHAWYTTTNPTHPALGNYFFSGSQSAYDESGDPLVAFITEVFGLTILMLESHQKEGRDYDYLKIIRNIIKSIVSETYYMKYILDRYASPGRLIYTYLLEEKKDTTFNKIISAWKNEVWYQSTVDIFYSIIK